MLGSLMMLLLSFALRRTKEYAFKMLDILRGQPDAGSSLFHNQKIWILTTEEARRGRAVEMRACGGDASIVVRRFSWVSQYCFLYCEYPTGENVAWLFLGVANTSIFLRDDEFLKYLKDHQNNFRFERM